ncbi:hypothetical protein [Streptoalloteichus tenebrarius]|nr:hypothetical protein [Streptoalloteichus tenebrarius]
MIDPGRHVLDQAEQTVPDLLDRTLAALTRRARPTHHPARTLDAAD